MPYPSDNQHRSVTLAIDAMGGDFGVATLVPAAVDALRADNALKIILTGARLDIDQALEQLDATDIDRLSVVEAVSNIPMDASPSRALRAARGSSMWAALECVGSGNADGMVSAGNTGALMILARRLLGMLPGIDRPALMTRLPSAKGHTYLLDLGANVDVKPLHLAQFGLMGGIFAEAIDRIENPGVGLLNVGSEDSKGHRIIQESARLLEAAPVNYAGFVEGNDIYQGEVAVVVCDGFIGNSVLKSSEGLARLLFGSLKAELSGSLGSRIAAFIARPVLKRWLARFDPAAHNGAALLGVNGTVVKSHGSSGRRATVHAIMTAAEEARNNVPGRIRQLLESLGPASDIFLDTPDDNRKTNGQKP